jgi:hypothetical protein
VEVALNCQLPAAFRPCGGGPEAGPEVLTPPPHPQSRTRAESRHAVLDKRFIRFKFRVSLMAAPRDRVLETLIEPDRASSGL